MNSTINLVTQAFTTATVKRRPFMQHGIRMTRFLIVTAEGAILGSGRTKMQAWDNALDSI